MKKVFEMVQSYRCERIWLKGQSIYLAAKAKKYLIYKLISLSENQNKAPFFPMYVIKNYLE